MFAIFLGILLMAAPKVQAQTLEEFFQEAVKNTATIREKEWDTQIAEQQKDQAFSQVLPTVTAESINVWRDQADVGPFGEAYQHTAFLSLNQPLFQGGSEYYNLAIARRLPKIAELEKRRQLRLLFAQVAQVFFQALRAQKDVELYLDQEKSLRDRIRTLKSRVDIGRSKPTELLAARSQLSRILAERSQSERQKIVFVNQLKTLCGLEQTNQLIDYQDPTKIKYKNDWANQVSETPQIKATELLLENAERAVASARGSYLPTVDANANYYLDRAGILQDSSWDVTVNARWELYEGGNDSSEIQIRKLQAKKIKAQLVDIKRAQRIEFNSLKEQFFLHQKTLKQFKEAVKVAKQNYQEHQKEADRGLVSDLDALQVLDNYLAVRRTYLQQIFETKITWVQLKALAGDIPKGRVR